MATKISSKKHCELVYGYDLPDDARKEFDFLSGEKLDFAMFFYFQNSWQYLGDYIPTDLDGWDGIMSTGYWTGILIQFCDADGDTEYGAGEFVNVATIQETTDV